MLLKNLNLDSDLRYGIVKGLCKPIKRTSLPVNLNTWQEVDSTKSVKQKSTKRFKLAFTLWALLSVSDVMASASRMAIDMSEEMLLTLKQAAARSYEDADHDKGSKVSQVVEELGGKTWIKKHFSCEGPKMPSSVGSIYFNEKKQITIISFHGSHWLSDWMQDIKFAQIPASSFFEDAPGYVHTGFLRLVAGSYPDMLSKLKKTIKKNPGPEDKIYITGHSLGGALAILTGIKLAQEFGIGQSAPIATFSAPRNVIGNNDFVEFATDLVPSENNLCFSTKGDIVPLVYPLYLTAKLFGKYSSIGMNIHVSLANKAKNRIFAVPPKSVDDLWSDPRKEFLCGYLVGKYVLSSVEDHALDIINKYVWAPRIPGLPYSTILLKAALISHSIPDDGATLEAFTHARTNYIESERKDEKAGEFSLSSHRHPIWKFLYNLAINR